MAITDNIFQGEDTTIRITVEDDEGTIIDLDDTSEIIVRLLDEGDNTIEKYNKAGTGGFRPLDIATPSSGIMDIHLNAAETDSANIGAIVKAEIKARFSDTDFDSSTLDSVTVVENIGIIRESQTKDDL